MISRIESDYAGSTVPATPSVYYCTYFDPQINEQYSHPQHRYYLMFGKRDYKRI